MSRVCSECQGIRFEIDSAQGSAFCVECGVVFEENAIVAEVTFGETSGGAAIVQGSHVAAGATHAKFNTPYGKQGSLESRAAAEARARSVLETMATKLGIRKEVTDRGYRWWLLAYESGFTRGRNAMLVVAACAYIGIRHYQKPIMLIDISDLLDANVFELGTYYLQLVQQFNISQLELVDPAFYIERFSKLLEFGEDRIKIRDDAINLVKRFERDWLHAGRRPSGICGAALLLAARMNNYRRSTLEVVQVVKIADTTLKKRLEEFGKTPSAEFSLEEFRHQWLDLPPQDPPSFKRAREKEQEEAKGVTTEKGEGKGKGKTKEKGVKSLPGKENRKAGKKRKRGVEDDAESVAESASPSSSTTSSPRNGRKRTVKELAEGPLNLADQSFLRVMYDEAATGPEDPNSNLIRDAEDVEMPLFLPDVDERAQSVLSAVDETERMIEDLVSAEITLPLALGPSDSELAQAFAQADELDQRRLEISRMSAPPPGEGDDIEIDDAEIDSYILTELEVKLKERVWVELNRQYLEQCAAKEAMNQGEEAPPSKKRKTSSKRGPRDSTTARGATPAEAAYAYATATYNRKKREAGEAPAKSKRINYDALVKLMTRTPKLGVETPSEAKRGLRTPRTPNEKKIAAAAPRATTADAEDEEEEDEEMETVEEDGPIPMYKALQGLHGRSAEEYEDYNEDVYNEGGYQEEV